MMKRVFICAPLRGLNPEDTADNIDSAISYARLAYQNHGAFPVVPHVMALWLDAGNPNQDEQGREEALRMLAGCDELWIFGDNITPGMDAEIQHALASNITVVDFTGREG